MIFDKTCCRLLPFLAGFYASIAFSAPMLPAALKQGHVTVQLGGYISRQGQTQHINIEELIGDEFTVTSHGSSNVLFGLGYFLTGQDNARFTLSYGINAFYLASTAVDGNVIQENLFTNLAYQYKLSHTPIYAIAKSTLHTQSPYALTLNAGMGVNFLRASGFQERSLDGNTLPDSLFSSHNITNFSATAGFGVKINQIFDSAPLECGYQFFYLGKGHYTIANTQVLNTLNTGNAYANALMCAMTI